MSNNDAIRVAKRVNDAFAAMPFDQLREIVVGADSYEEVTAKAKELGQGDLIEHIDPEIEVGAGGFTGAAALPSGRGFDVWLAFWREWLEPWEDLDFRPSGYEALGTDGDWVIVDAKVTARGGMSGVPVELAVAQLWRVRDGRAVRYEVYEKREQAVAAVDAGEDDE